MKLILSSTLLLICSLIYSQENEDFIGKWDFVTLTSEKMAEKEIDMMNGMFGSMTFEFNSKGIYITTVMGRDEKGVYELSKKKDQLLLTSEAGILQDYDLVEISQSALVLGYKDSGLVFSRDEDWIEIIEDEKIIPADDFIIDRDLIIGNWEYVEFKFGDKEEFDNTFTSLLEDGDHLYLFKNGKYEQAAFGHSAKGKWELSENKKFLLLYNKKNVRSFPVLSLDDSELIIDVEFFKGYTILTR